MRSWTPTTPFRPWRAASSRSSRSSPKDEQPAEWAGQREQHCSTDRDARPLNQVFSERLSQAQFTGLVFALIAVIAVLLSAVGHYALVAFTVSERAREIAIRMTLGAQGRRIAGGILRRAVAQLGVGVLLGVWLGASLLREFVPGATAAHPGWPALLAAVAAVMMATGLLACVGPTRRALKIQPSRALGGPG